MQELELKQLWQNYNQQLSASLAINQELLKETKKIKVNNLLTSIRPLRLFAIVIGIIWVLFVDGVVIVSFLAGNYYLFFSALIHSLVTKLAIGVSIYHLVLIRQMRLSDSILEVQKKLSQFKISMLTAVRLSLLQLPVFTTFYLNKTMLSNIGPLGWTIQIVITLVFLWAGIWCFQNFKMKNADKKWFQNLIGDEEWQSLNKAETILNQISDLEKSSDV